MGIGVVDVGVVGNVDTVTAGTLGLALCGVTVLIQIRSEGTENYLIVYANYV